MSRVATCLQASALGLAPSRTEARELQGAQESPGSAKETREKSRRGALAAVEGGFLNLRESRRTTATPDTSLPVGLSRVTLGAHTMSK